MLCAGLVAAVGATLADPRAWFGSPIPLLLLGGLLLLTHVKPQRFVWLRGAVETIQFDAVVLVPMLLMVGPAGTLIATAVASVAGSLVARRDLVRTAFNLGQLLLATSAGVALVGQFGSGSLANAGVEPRDLMLAMSGVLLFELLSAVVVDLMVTFTQKSSPADILRDLPRQVVPWTGAILLGAVGTVATLAAPIAGFLVVLLVVFVYHAYAASMTEFAARRQAEEVHRAAAALRAHTDSAHVRRDLLTAARELVGADDACLVNDPHPIPEDALAVRMSGPSWLVVSGRRGVGTWTKQDRATLTSLAEVACDVLRATEVIERFRTITNSQSEGLIAFGTDGLVTFANPSARRLTGLLQEELHGRHIGDVCVMRKNGAPVDLVEAMRERLRYADQEGELSTLHMPEPLAVSFTLTPLTVGDEHTGAVLVFRDVTQQRALQQALTRHAFHDELTGLPNRRLLMERLDKALARSERYGVRHGLLFFDLDRFKFVNDSFGHRAGDELLVHVAARVRRSVPGKDTVARLSGDEFVVLVEDVYGSAPLIAVAERLLEVLSTPYEVCGHEVAVSASIGIVLTQRGDSRDDLLAAADAAAYEAKNRGRNCYHVAAEDNGEHARARMSLETSLRRAVEQDELVVHYQPLVTTGGLTVVGVEALVRWNRPGEGLVPPARFIPLAEENGLIVPIGQWVLAEACRTVQQWTTAHPELPSLSVSVNLSARQFSRRQLTDEIAGTLLRSGLAPQQLCLEITESAMMVDTGSTIATLRSLRELGVRLAIDDFGTGYSSLSYLKSFPIDAVKIDQTFVREIGQSRADTEIVAAVVRLAAALGIDAIAEGVETPDQRDRLIELGCSVMQGYLVAPPLGAASFLDSWRPAGRAVA